MSSLCGFWHCPYTFLENVFHTLCHPAMPHFGPRGPPRYGQTLSRLDHIRLLGETGKDLLLSELACYKQVLASVLRLTIWTTSDPYLVKAQRAATVRDVG